MRVPYSSPPSSPFLKMWTLLSKTLKVQKWVIKSSRCGRWRTGRCGVAVLLTGALFCLLIPALTPHPSPAESRRPLRRIHQEEEYTAPKSSQGSGIQDTGRNLVESPIAPLPKSLAYVIGLAVTSHTPVNNQSAAALKSQSEATPAAAWDVKKIFPKLAQVPGDTKKAKIDNIKAQEAALHAMQFGYKLTQAQKKIMQELTPQARKELEARMAKTRMAQDRVYLTHLRTRKQIVPRPGGGEQIVSMANRTVRFPAMLKKAPIKNWPQQYKVYQNLTHYPWIRSRGCEKFSITFSPPGSLPPRGLASFPSSGNTWVRYLIEGATGVFTGSLYDDTSLMTKGLYGEGLLHDSGMTILQKSHGYTTGDAMTIQDRSLRSEHNHLQELGYRGVVVIRNPFKALISHRNLDVGGHTGYAPRAHFLGQGWADFVTLKVKLWRDFYEDWVRKTSPQDIYVAHYELIRDDPVREMRGILSYLRIPQDESRLSCLGRNLDGLFKRKPKRNLQLDFDPFTEELRGVIYDAITTVDVALRERGKDGLPLGKYEIYNPAEVEVLRERRRNGDAMKVFT